MSADYAELDCRQTPLGELTLRRRRILSLDRLEIYEVKLGDAFLMSSLFHEVEEALADLGLDALSAVIEWHERGLVPLGPELTGDPRCRFIHGDFFALAATPEHGVDP